MKSKNKRADMTSKQLVTMVVLIISFALILLIWVQLKLSGNVDASTCEASVAAKKAMISNPLTRGKLIDTPLKCKTEQICLMTGSNNEECNIFGEEYQRVIVANEEEVFKAIADNMANCWKMMGKGQGSLIFTRSLEMGMDRRGVICSEIGFSGQFKIKYPNLNAANMNKYMNAHKVGDGDLTYWQYLLNIQQPKEPVKYKLTEDELSNRFISTSEPLAVTFIESKIGAFSNMLGAGSLFALGGIVGSGLGAGGVALLSAAGASGGSWLTDRVSTLLAGTSGESSSLLLITYDVEQLKKLEIDDFESLS